MATFSWSDNLKIAFRSCSPCLWPLHDNDDDIDDGLDGNNNFSRLNHRSGLSSLSRSEELHGLLANAADSTDTDTETMSLHSNPGRSQRNKKKKKSNTRRRSTRTSSDDNHDDSRRRRITLFGYNLFGRLPAPTPPIQLADDSEDALYRHSSARHGSSSTTTLNRSSASTTFDSDAAPLDTDTIAALSSPTTAAAVIKAAAQSSAELEAQRLKEKEERRRRRKERKELKRVAEMLAREGIVGDGDEFEGFQGSGSGAPSTYPRIPDGMLPSVVSDPSGSVSKGQREEQPLNVASPHDARNDDDDDDDKADLDGSHYARNTSGISNRGSSDNDSRSRTSTNSNHKRPNEAERRTPLAESKQTKKIPKDKHSGSSSRTTKSSSSKTSSSQLPQSPRQLVSPSTIEQGQGFFDLEDDDDGHINNNNNNTTLDRPEPSQSRGYLPITGFGGNTFASSRMASNMGAMLAQRGGNED